MIVAENLAGFRGDSCLVQDEDTGEYFLVSTVTKADFADTAGEVDTFAFRADADGNVFDWDDVAGGADMTRDDVIAILASGELYDWASEGDSGWVDDDYLADLKDLYSAEDWEDFTRDDPAFDV